MAEVQIFSLLYLILNARVEVLDISYIIIGVFILFKIINDYGNLTLEKDDRNTGPDGLVM